MSPINALLALVLLQLEWKCNAHDSDNEICPRHNATTYYNDIDDENELENEGNMKIPNRN